MVIEWVASVHSPRRLYWRFDLQDGSSHGARTRDSSLHRAAQTVYKRTRNRVLSTTTCRSSHSMREGQGQGLSSVLHLFECRIYLYYRM